MRWLISLVLLLLPVAAHATNCCIQFDKNVASLVTSCRVIPKEYSCGQGEGKLDCEKYINSDDDPQKLCKKAMNLELSKAPPAQPPEFKIARPRLQIPLLTLKPFTGTFNTFKDPLEIEEGEKRFLLVDALAVYLVALYKLLVGISGVVAGIIIVWAGVKWLTSAGSPDRITEARKHIADASVGLILVLGSYLILNIINPELTIFKPLRIQLVERETLEFDAGDVIPGEASYPTEITKPTWTYATFDCNKPLAPAGVAPPGAMITFSCPVGINGEITVLSEMKEPLCKAGKLAAERGYTLLVTSSYRPYQKQVEIWCGTGKEKTCFNTYPDTMKRKKFCAVPGFSNHGHGRAIDVKLLKNGKPLFDISSTRQCQAPKNAVETIADIFYQADPGWVRYEAEIWHFEYNPKGVGERGLFFDYPKKCKE